MYLIVLFVKLALVLDLYHAGARHIAAVEIHRKFIPELEVVTSFNTVTHCEQRAKSYQKIKDTSIVAILTLSHEYQRPNILKSNAVTRQDVYDTDFLRDQQKLNGFQNWATDSGKGQMLRAERLKSTGTSIMKLTDGDLKYYSLSNNIGKINKVLSSSKNIALKNGQKIYKDSKRIRRAIETENQNTTGYSVECEVPSLSCRNCCNNSSNCSHQSTFCRCDPQCTFYNDCCVDYETFCGKKEEISFGIDREGLSCIIPQYVDLNSDSTRVWMVNKCPNNRKIDEISQSCENADELELNITNIQKLVPVIGQNKLTFRNQFCAKCNGIEHFEYFGFNLKCYVVPPASISSFAELTEFASKYCAPNNWLFIFREANQPIRECNQYFRNLCPTLNELNETCNQRPLCVNCTSRIHWCNLNLSKWDDNAEKTCTKLCIGEGGVSPSDSPGYIGPSITSITSFTVALRLSKQGAVFEVKEPRCPLNGQFYDRYLETCRAGQSISSPVKHNLDRYDVVVWLDTKGRKGRQLYPTLNETISSLAELFNFKRSQVSVLQDIQTENPTYRVIRFELELTSEQMLRLGKDNHTNDAMLRFGNDSGISTNVLPLRRLLFFSRKFNVTISKPGWDVDDTVYKNNLTLTVFKTTSRQLACIGKQTYPKGTYSLLQYGKYYINSTGETFAKNQVFFDEDRNDSISVCVQIVPKDCDGLRINLTSEEYVKFDNLSIFYNRTKTIYDFGEYDIENGNIFMCIPEYSSKIIHWIPGDSDVVEKYLTLICLVVSLACLFLVIQTYLIFAELRNLPGKNVLSLSISLFLVQLLWLIPDRRYSSTLCHIAAVIKHYLFLVSFVAMATIAWDTHSVFASNDLPKPSSSKFYKYSAIVWGLPAMFVAACAVVDQKEIYAVYANDLLCCWATPVIQYHIIRPDCILYATCSPQKNARTLARKRIQLYSFNFFYELANFQDDLRFFVYFDDGEVEYDADSAEEKNKICSLLDGIVSDNKNLQFSGLNSLSRARAASLSVKRVIKEGQIEKRGHSAAFLTWSKRYLRIKEGELAYYKVGEENMTALNIIKLGPGHAFIKKAEHNAFIVSTQKKEY
ncbi:Cadherin EGF LAG seven-pass G-type receptor 1, partial [Paramuricea clavata]